MILITGATSGIGRHAALTLAKSGHRVLATGRQREPLEALLAEARGLPLEIEVLDVTKPEQIERVVQTLDRLTQGAGPDVLINNAGYALAGPLAELSDEDLKAQFETNVFGLMSLTRAVLPFMFRNGRGRILNVSSVSGRISAPFLGAYHATKFALETLSDALRMELHPFGIQVILIEPGTIKTGFAARTLQEVGRIWKPDSRYAPLQARIDDIKQTFENRASGPEPVVRAIERAIRARRPRARYVAPWHFNLLILLMTILPTWLIDAATRQVFGLTPEVLKSNKVVKGNGGTP